MPTPAIIFGDANDPFLVNAAPRLISSAVGTGTAKFLIFIAIVGQFFCGLASVTANSRMIYAFSRDGALPGSKHWHKINQKTRTPTNSVWLGVALSAIVGRSSLYVAGHGAGRYSTAFFAMTGICVIGLYIAYAIPIYLRLTNPDFQTGTVEPEGVPQARRLDLDHLDRVHHDPVLRAAVLAVLADLGRQQPDPRRRRRQRVLQAEQLQLHRSADPPGGPRDLALLDAQREEVVQGPEGAGHQGRAHGHRAGTRRTRLKPACVGQEMGLPSGGGGPISRFDCGGAQSIGFAASASQSRTRAGWPGARSC